MVMTCVLCFAVGLINLVDSGKLYLILRDSQPVEPQFVQTEGCSRVASTGFLCDFADCQVI